MNVNLTSVLKWSGLIVIVSLGLVACPSTSAEPPSPPPGNSSVPAEGGSVQLVNWTELHAVTGVFQFFGYKASTNLSSGTVDAQGRLSFKLATPPATELIKVGAFFGTGCTITPPDSSFAAAYLLVQAKTQTSAHSTALVWQHSQTALSVGDEVLDFWAYAPQAFTAKGAKGCSSLASNSAIDASLKQGWNYFVEEVTQVSPDGKMVLEWKAKTLAALPKDYLWFERPADAPANVKSLKGWLEASLPKIKL
jgi:hypothetical protein